MARVKRSVSKFFNTNKITDGMVLALEALYRMPMTKEDFVKAIVPSEQYEKLREGKIWARDLSRDFKVDMRFDADMTLELQLETHLILPPPDMNVSGRLDEPLFEVFRDIREMAKRWGVVIEVAQFWHQHKYPLEAVKYYWPAGAHFLNDGNPVEFPAKHWAISGLPLESIRESATILAMEKLIPTVPTTASRGYLRLRKSDWNYIGMNLYFADEPVTAPVTP